LLKKAVFWDVAPCGSVRTDILEERVASTFKVERMSELGTILTFLVFLILYPEAGSDTFL
jgi:hypothetical protein